MVFPALVPSQPTKPVVAWTTFLAAADWNNNISYWQISDTTYKLEFVIDAGTQEGDKRSTQTPCRAPGG